MIIFFISRKLRAVGGELHFAFCIGNRVAIWEERFSRLVGFWNRKFKSGRNFEED